ncbi:lysylphosphatidylglycerol synthase transmembrane domain-containing protein [Microbacterium sp. SSW1-59]|uniref:lysylphosphatidylglycerol synthase transmembrane domain-containing protein n=1 Tax=Microbacterium xanthum TaxID=3079794 RepID=UPI002AD55B81|nr:lysylphosphatidylglycerol synthase transmembrane domain-containing protein [Microbacterium sp. SSW1-59]MDZ8201410.1 lysylphosphatidylglycerol synthase transmembrane domain-containing protein [Microbacterium sp. SSW1-59]
MSAPHTPAGTRARWVRLAQAGVTILLLVLLWRLVDGADALALLASADPRWLAAAVALVIAHTLLVAWRWKVTAAPLGLHLSARTAVEEYFLAQLINSALPGGVLGDVGRAARSRHRASLRVSTGAVAVERGVGQVALVTVFTGGVIATLLTPAGFRLPDGWLTGVAVALAVASVIGAGVFAAGIVAARRPGSWAARVARGLHLSALSRRVLPAQAGLSLAAVACLLIAYGCCTIAVGAPLPAGALVTLVPLILISMVLPISIGGWGVRETAAVSVLPAAGLTGAQALASSVAFGLVALVATLPGLLTLWTSRHRPPLPHASHPPRPLPEDSP